VVLTALEEGKLEIPESVEGLDNCLGVGEDGPGIGSEPGAGSLAGFPVGRRRGVRGIGESLSREAE
jgi:hypothetical protein